MSLTALHERPRLKNSHAYPPTRHEVNLGRRMCCAVKFVARNREVVLTRIALALGEINNKPCTKAEAVQSVSETIYGDCWSLDELLAWFWFRYVDDSHRKFVVDKALFCEGEG